MTLEMIDELEGMAAPIEPPQARKTKALACKRGQYAPFVAKGIFPTPVNEGCE